MWRSEPLPKSSTNAHVHVADIEGGLIYRFLLSPVPGTLFPCSSSTSAQSLYTILYLSMSSEGKIPFKVGSQTYETWYKIYGDLKTSNERPIVVLHGGPGMSHHYMLPNKILYEKAGIPVILYDQIGNGASSHCPGVPKEFWVPSLFMDELDNLTKSLGIYDNFDLLGQSWGGMLAAEYAASRTPTGLKRLIIANSPASIALCTAGMDALLLKFPQEFVTLIRKHEADGTTNSQEYQDAAMTFYKKHTCTTDPWPEELKQSFDEFNKDPTVYHTMLGPSEFTTTGNLKDWDITGIIHQIVCPTLVISAPLDEIQECAVLPFFLKIPKVKWVELQNSTHLGQFEEPERYFKVVMDFLKNVEAN